MSGPIAETAVRLPTRGMTPGVQASPAQSLWSFI
jgi:hypothetical protein